MSGDVQQLTRVALRAAILLAFNIALGAALCYAVQIDRSPKRWQTAGTLYLIHKREHHDTLILGSSRTFYFSRCRGAHERLERALNRPVLNLSTPAGGVLLAKMHMEEFWARGNTCDDLVYFADTPYFYSKFGNERLPVLEYQPFSASFFWRLIANNVEPATIMYYVRSKFTLSHFVFEPLKHRCSETIPEARAQNPERATRARNANVIQNEFYDMGVTTLRLDHYIGILEDFIELAKVHDTRLILVCPPTLLTAEPGENSFKQAIQALATETGVPFYDFSATVQDPLLFTDMDHMNERGAAHFAREFLAPILDAQPR